MSKRAFKVEGDFQMGRLRQHFAIQVVGDDEEMAREYAYANMGSRHGVKRREIELTTVTPLEGDDIDPITLKRLE